MEGNNLESDGEWEVAGCLLDLIELVMVADGSPRNIFYCPFSKRFERVLYSMRTGSIWIQQHGWSPGDLPCARSRNTRIIYLPMTLDEAE